MIKIRKAKKSERGLYIQDRELRETNFTVGSHFKYVVDQKNKQIVIVVFCKRKVQRIAMKNAECCHPIFFLFSRQCIC